MLKNMKTKANFCLMLLFLGLSCDGQSESLFKKSCLKVARNRSLKAHNNQESSYLNYGILEEGVELKCQKVENFTNKEDNFVTFYFMFLRGFDLKLNRLFYSNINSYYIFIIVIQQSYFDFYVKESDIGNYRLVNISSTLDLVSSYHNLTINKTNISKVTLFWQTIDESFSMIVVAITTIHLTNWRTIFSLDYSLLFKNKSIRIHFFTILTTFKRSPAPILYTCNS